MRDYRVVGGLRVATGEPDPALCSTCGHAVVHHNGEDCQGCYVESNFTSALCARVSVRTRPMSDYRVGGGR